MNTYSKLHKEQIGTISVAACHVKVNLSSSYTGYDLVAELSLIIWIQLHRCFIQTRLCATKSGTHMGGQPPHGPVPGEITGPGGATIYR